MHGTLQRYQDLFTEARRALGADKELPAIKEPLQDIQRALDAANDYCEAPGVGGIDRKTADDYLINARTAVERLWREVCRTRSRVVPESDLMRLDARTAVCRLRAALLPRDRQGDCG